jgi:hypothetical protein
MDFECLQVCLQIYQKKQQNTNVNSLQCTYFTNNKDLTLTFGIRFNKQTETVHQTGQQFGSTVEENATSFTQS